MPTRWFPARCSVPGLGFHGFRYGNTSASSRSWGTTLHRRAKAIRLIDSPDIPFPWEFPNRESQMHYYPEISSTMDQARHLTRKGCPHFTVVIADRQTKGRGRLNRRWYSSMGGLYFTIALRPDIPPVLSFRINFAASSVLAQLLRNRYQLDAAVKWPNDILINDQKVAGILSEM